MLRIYYTMKKQKQILSVHWYFTVNNKTWQQFTLCWFILLQCKYFLQNCIHYNLYGQAFTYTRTSGGIILKTIITVCSAEDRQIGVGEEDPPWRRSQMEDSGYLTRPFSRIKTRSCPVIMATCFIFSLAPQPWPLVIRPKCPLKETVKTSNFQLSPDLPFYVPPGNYMSLPSRAISTSSAF